MQYYLPSHLLSSWTYCNFFSSTKWYLLIRLTACIFPAVFSALWFRSLVWMSYKVQNLFRSWSWQRIIISQNWYLFMESQPWNLPNIVMAALNVPLFRTPISDLQQMSVHLQWSSQRNSAFVKGGLVELLLFIMLITALNLLFSELHSNLTCATKFFSEMLSIKSTCSYVLWEHSMAFIFWADANHWRFPRFKMSCCTWAWFKSLVFIGMLTAKFWAYLNPQSKPQF